MKNWKSKESKPQSIKFKHFLNIHGFQQSRLRLLFHKEGNIRQWKLAYTKTNETKADHKSPSEAREVFLSMTRTVHVYLFWYLYRGKYNGVSWYFSKWRLSVPLRKTRDSNTRITMLLGTTYHNESLWRETVPDSLTCTIHIY